MTGYTLEQVRKMAPEEISGKLNELKDRQTAWRSRVSKVLALRQAPPPTYSNPVEAKAMSFFRNYNQKYIRTGSAVPLFHIMLTVGAVGIGMEYLTHHRHTNAAKAAAAAADAEKH